MLVSLASHPPPGSRLTPEQPARKPQLVHHRGRDWAFHYDGMGDEEEEPIFRFDRHRFVVGEYVSITEHDGVQRTFRVAKVLPAP